MNKALLDTDIYSEVLKAIDQNVARNAASYRRAIGLFREIGDRIPAAQSLNHLGDACRAADDDLAARDAWQQALIILDELAHPEAAVIRDKLRSVATADHSATG